MKALARDLLWSAEDFVMRRAINFSRRRGWL